MPRDCPHDHCNFFLSSSAERCPACGRRISSFDRAWVVGPLVAIVVLVALILWPVRSSLVAGIAMVLAVALAVGVATRPWRNSPPFETLQDRYQQACDESRYWLERWSELFALAAHNEGERLLRYEALSGAADAAADVAARRNDYAGRFIANGFDRLDHLIATQSSQPSPDAIAEIQTALDTIEGYLDTLWIDHDLARRANTQLAEATLAHIQPRQQNAQLLQLAGSVRLFDPGRRTGPVGFDLETERFRLRAERILLRESPLTDADFFDEPL